MEWEQYIVSDKDILLEKPTVKGTRISVELVLELLSNGWSEEMVINSYQQIKHVHLKAILRELRN